MKTNLEIGVEVIGVSRILRRIRKLGNAGHLPDRTRKRLLKMADNGGLIQSKLRRGRSHLTLVVTPAYELKRILWRLEARAEKAAA